MMRVTRTLGNLCIVILFTGCTATQPVVWRTAGDMDLTKGGKVSVTAACEVAPHHIDYLQNDIQQKVKTVLTGSEVDPDAYSLEVKITRYDEGSAFARFMLIGLGQMYLYGTVQVTHGEPPAVVREGDFKKNYCVGGIVGGMATMEKDVLPKVGGAIVNAIKTQQVKLNDGSDAPPTTPAVLHSSTSNANAHAETAIHNKPEATQTTSDEATSEPTTEDKLRTLKQLKEDGLLSQEEYNSKKQSILEKY